MLDCGPKYLCLHGGREAPMGFLGPQLVYMVHTNMCLSFTLHSFALRSSKYNCCVKCGLVLGVKMEPCSRVKTTHTPSWLAACPSTSPAPITQSCPPHCPCLTAVTKTDHHKCIRGQSQGGALSQFNVCRCRQMRDRTRCIPDGWS